MNSFSAGQQLFDASNDLLILAVPRGSQLPWPGGVLLALFKLLTGVNYWLLTLLWGQSGKVTSVLSLWSCSLPWTWQMTKLKSTGVRHLGRRWVSCWASAPPSQNSGYFCFWKSTWRQLGMCRWMWSWPGVPSTFCASKASDGASWDLGDNQQEGTYSQTSILLQQELAIWLLPSPEFNY